MATSHLKTYTAVGNREDLSDVITNISPVDTMFYSSLAEAGCTSTKHEFQTDSLAAAGSNKLVQGADTSIGDIAETVRLDNYTQIQGKSFQISNTQESVTSAGRSSDVDYQTAKKMKELAKDIEYAFLRGVKAVGDASTAAEMRGALNWMTTNTVILGTGASQNGTTGVISGSTGGGALTSAAMKTASQNIFTQGGDPSVAYCGPFQKTQISTFAQDSNSNYRVAVEEKKLTDTVDVYVNDFYTLAIKPHRIMPTDEVFICDPDYWKKATLRPTFKEELAKTGDSVKYHIVVEHTLEACAENASARIANLTTS